MRRDLADPELFGNEAGEDEEPDILSSYYLDKDEFDYFFSKKKKLGFVRSRKGMGKSALLSYTLHRNQNTNDPALLIYVKASDLYSLQTTSSTSPSDMIYGWQQKICTRINIELGSTLKTGFDDDSIFLIESAEVAGFRKRNIVSALVDRLGLKGVGLEAERIRLAPTDSHAVLERIQQNKDVHVWMFIDDIDATFINTEQERLRISTFFSACRNLVNTVEGLNIRASVRTDVWSILAQYDEALDKCEQYMLDLTWSTEDTGRILERKILSYFKRYYPDDKRFTTLDLNSDRSNIRKLVFKEPFKWGSRRVEAYRPIHILSAGRPRWAAQLCKLSGKDALAKRATHIGIGHIKPILKQYGRLRLDDLYKEHRHQCDRLEDIVEIFSGGSPKYSTQELLAHLTEKFIRHRGLPKIDDEPAENGSLSVANFLYRIGFIKARDDKDATGLGFVGFEQRPNLLSSKSNLDDGLIWEVHPAYRDILRIKKDNDK
jgi:hypothetical protein